MVGKAVFADGVIVAQKVTVHAVVVPDIEGGVFVFIKLRVFHIRVGVEVGIAVKDAIKMLIVPVAAEAFGGEGEAVAVVTGAEVGARPVVVKIEAHALALVVHGATHGIVRRAGDILHEGRVDDDGLAQGILPHAVPVAYVPFDDLRLIVAEEGVSMDGESAALAVPVWQQHAIVAQEEVVEKTVEEDHRPAARLGQLEFSAPAESPASAVGVKALRTVKV